MSVNDKEVLANVLAEADAEIPGSGRSSEARGSRRRFAARAWASLQTQRAPLALAGLALLMSLPSLGLGFQLDDRTYIRLFAAGRTPFNILYESPTAIVYERYVGVFAWWSGQHFSVHFFRPLTAVWHWLDQRLWPESAWLMHLENCLIYALLVAIVAALYRELVLSSAKVAALAALMFAVDESHAQSVGWIASRHLLLSTLLALASLLLHVRGRRQQRAWLRWGGVACCALALLSGEFGLTALAYLVAYAWILEPGRLRARLASIWPQLLLGVVWLAAYATSGFGVRAASWFRDPWTAPAATLGGGLADLPIWLVSQLGGDVANLALGMPQNLARALALALLLPLLALLVQPLAASKAARFFATGMLLSCLLLFSTVPQDRLLLAASFGGFGWLACFVDGVTERSSAFLRSCAAGLCVPHLIVAPLAFIPLLGGLSAIDACAVALAELVPATGTVQAIVVNIPLELLTNAAWSVRDGSEIPLHQLYAGFSPLTATRPDARTLELTVEPGWGTRPLERMFNTAEGMPKRGELRQVAGMRATVIDLTPDGLPQRVRFEFPDALETEGRVWLVWDGRRPTRWQPPPVGATHEVPGASMLSLLL